ncbi:DUF3772 domain-containing protein [Algicella marina]|uniref:DUF3772 domain-containing protein n=1 Tax=Algicella marina TaxID=2683284 RepID=A0A6P1T2B6_9RHOB|nr:DUF3772 domain-containing protein [Algicella marina]QHQ35449.1 DUF3772 domain-containing protein [Algicella marina]
MTDQKLATYARLANLCLSGILTLCLLVAAPQLHAQSEEDTSIAAQTATWSRLVQRGETLIASEEATVAELDAVRSDLAEQRSDALSAEESAQAELASIRATLESLGPKPAEGQTEAETVAAERVNLNQRLQEAQANLLAARAAREDTAEILARIDSRMRTQFSNRLISLGPSPVLPQNWPGAAIAVVSYFQELQGEVLSTLDNRFERERTLQRLPFAGVMMVLGLLLLFVVRRRIVGWVLAYLERSSASKASAWGGTVLNLARLIVPSVGAALFIVGLKTLDLFGPAGDAVVAALPQFAAFVILSYWIGHSIFAPAIERYRLVTLNDEDAHAGSFWTQILGLFAALQFLLAAILEQQQADETIAAVLKFPVLLLAALSLWRLAALFSKALTAGKVESEGDEQVMDAFGTGSVRVLRKLAVFVAIVSPLLAAIGYTALSDYVFFSFVMSAGVFGAAYVFFATFLRLLEAVMKTSDDSDGQSGDSFGLLPVFAGFLIALACLPVLALIWGARQSDLLEAWVWLRDGISIGGSRISLTDLLALIVVFGIGYTLTRALQSALRRTVLPRTKLDVGGQNAVSTGVGYLGIFVAAVVAITATGLDLSNLAIVAGALSVGVGFGLQTIVSNFVSGIILLIERPIKQGDWIEVAGYSGYVRKISVRSTEIETFDRSNVIVPNQELIAGTVLNYTHGSMNGRVIVPVGVAYGTDVKKVEALLKDIAENHPLVIRTPPPAVLFMGFGADSLDFEIRAILRDVNNMLSVKSQMNYQIYEKFTEEGIEIPFAQRDLWLRNPEELAKSMGGREAAGE